ncbi:MAG: 2-C-methyl-D-erythritol 4-phosphate cytidylyltransferase [Bacilli bacterium]|nr:2-C-methyl-D-erythritol 4-phosphate cytidylyltransferase [Bacilli bacterium]
MKYSAIILAAGSGKRSGLEFNKILYEINGKKIIDYSLDFFQTDADCVQVILVSSRQEIDSFSRMFQNEKIEVVVGGETRQESVRLALEYVQNDVVLVHDGARPFIPREGVNKLLLGLEENDSVTLGVKAKDTIQEIEGNRIVRTLDRDRLILTQTPQGFKKDKLLRAHNLAFKHEFEGTDDTVLLDEFLKIKALFVEGDYRNIKFTTIEDIEFLEVILV